MRTRIDIDDRLMRQAMRCSGAATKRDAVEEGLRLLVKTYAQTSVRRLRGKVRWEGDLNESRLGRVRRQAYVGWSTSPARTTRGSWYLTRLPRC